MLRATLALFLAIALGACAPGDAARSYAPAAGEVAADGAMTMEAEVASSPAAAAEQTLLALTHSVIVTADAAAVPVIHARLRERCAADRANACTVFGSSVHRNEDASSASLTLRIRAAGVEPLLAVIGSDGEIERRETTSEDVTHAIRDGDARLRMLREYRERLLELQRTGSRDIETLMKLAEQLATVQSQLEQAEGEQKHLRGRVERDLVDIRIDSDAPVNSWRPVGDAIDDIPVVLAMTVASIISFLTAAIPIALVAIPVLWLFVRWRRRRSRTST